MDGGSDYKTPLELALEREADGGIDYCDECEYVAIIRGAGYCGISGKLLHPMMLERGPGGGPARRCEKRKEARKMGLTGADLARMCPAAQRQVLEKLGMLGKTSQTRKYHNQPTTVNGIKFDSKKEASRFVVLSSMQNAGMIRNLRLQAQYTLQESYVTDTGERVRAIRYVADFAYERVTAPDCNGDVHWIPVVEDVKSTATRTAQYEMKKKLLKERFNLTITEV